MSSRTTAHAWGQGDRRWFLNSVATIAVSGESSGGLMDVVTQTLPAGYCPPRHVHQGRDELLVVVDGEVELTCGDDRTILSAGAVAHIPRGVEHALMVSLAGPAEVVLVSAPAGLAGIIADFGEPLPQGPPPQPRIPDLQALARAGERHDVIIAPELLA